MKLVIAYIPPDRLDSILSGLTQHRIHGLTVSHAQGFGQEHDRQHPDYRPFAALDLTKKLRLEIACHDEESDGILKAIYDSAHTGNRGNGKVFVVPILDAMRLKTGERGPAAIGAII